VRTLAVRELSDYTDVAVLDRLIDVVQHDPDHRVRCAAISGLGSFVYIAASAASDPETDHELACVEDCLSDDDFERAYGFLLDVYRDDQRSLEEKCYAVESLSFFSNDTVESLIAQIYASSKKEAKKSALIAMGCNGSMRWVDIVRKELYNPDRDLQLEAIAAAGDIGLESLGKDLRRLTFSEDEDVMLSALWALGQTGWDGAFERIDELTIHPDPDIREAADESMEEWLFYNGLASDYEESETGMEGE
jgi:HEAT repeat protein